MSAPWLAYLVHTSSTIICESITSTYHLSLSHHNALATNRHRDGRASATPAVKLYDVTYTQTAE